MRLVETLSHPRFTVGGEFPPAMHVPIFNPDDAVVGHVILLCYITNFKFYLLICFVTKVSFFVGFYSLLSTLCHNVNVVDHQVVSHVFTCLHKLVMDTSNMFFFLFLFFLQ